MNIVKLSMKAEGARGGGGKKKQNLVHLVSEQPLKYSLLCGRLTTVCLFLRNQNISTDFLVLFY